MEYVKIKGNRLPKLGFGTWELSGDECVEGVRHALSLGYRHIDTAQAYQNEQHVGTAMQQSGVDREDIFLTTKIWAGNLAYEDVKKSFSESLEKLKTDYVDLLLIHWPNRDIPLKDTLKAFDELVNEGRIRNIGVSNFNIKLLKEAQSLAKNRILCNQVEFHPFLNQDKLLEYCKDNDIMITAYSPLARGEVVRNEALQKIGEKYGKSAAQVALRWVLSHNKVATIPKAASAKHREQNLAIFDFGLTDDEMKAIHGLERGQRMVETPYSPEWD